MGFLIGLPIFFSGCLVTAVNNALSDGGGSVKYYSGKNAEEIKSNVLYEPCSDVESVSYMNVINNNPVNDTVNAEFRRGYLYVGESRCKGPSGAASANDATMLGHKIGAGRM
ncbi:MAG: hypothetical protein ACK5LP_10260, partial [Campylobacteraceae bacterium]